MPRCLSLYIWYYVWIAKIRLICFNLISCRVIIKSLYLFLHIFWLKRLNILDWLVNWLLSLLGWLFLWLLLSLAFFNIYLVCDWFLIFIIYDEFFIFQVHEWFNFEFTFDFLSGMHEWFYFLLHVWFLICGCMELIFYFLFFWLHEIDFNFGIARELTLTLFLH